MIEETISDPLLSVSALQTELNQRTEELAVINSIQEALAKKMDMQGIYDLVGDRLCELFPDTQALVIRTFDHAMCCTASITSLVC